jgi:uncharacterized protein (TIGR02271 family)
MNEFTEAYDFNGRTLYDRNGDKIGKVDDLYTDREGGQPEWALVQSGLFGSKKTFVPLSGARPDGEDVRVTILKAQVKDAPHIDPDGELSDAEERRLFEHYDVPYTEAGSTTATGGAGAAGAAGAGAAGAGAAGAGAAGARPEGRDVSGPTTDDAMTRSEEELRVGKERVETGRARLRKYVVTEHVTKTVPVQREEVRVEREPITDENVDRAMAGPELSEEEHEVVTHEERPVVDKKTVPKERVRLSKDTETGEEQVSEEVRKERIETDDRPDR